MGAGQPAAHWPLFAQPHGVSPCAHMSQNSATGPRVSCELPTALFLLALVALQIPATWASLSLVSVQHNERAVTYAAPLSLCCPLSVPAGWVLGSLRTPLPGLFSIMNQSLTVTMVQFLRTVVGLFLICGEMGSLVPITPSWPDTEFL